MNDEAAGGVHWSFWVIGAVALIWNAMGVMNYFGQMNAEMVAAMSEAKRAIIEGRPAWATGAFAVAVFGGSIGGILLLLRKSAAYYLFIVSLVGMIAQMIPYLGMDDSTMEFGPFEISMFIVMPLAVAGFLIWYSKFAEGRGWIVGGKAD